MDRICTCTRSRRGLLAREASAGGVGCCRVASYRACPAVPGTGTSWTTHSRRLRDLRLQCPVSAAHCTMGEPSLQICDLAGGACCPGPVAHRRCSEGWTCVALVRRSARLSAPLLGRGQSSLAPFIEIDLPPGHCSVADPHWTGELVFGDQAVDRRSTKPGHADDQWHPQERRCRRFEPRGVCAGS